MSNLSRMERLMTENDRKKAGLLSTAWRFFNSRNMVDGFGHISARMDDPNHFLITPHSTPSKSSPEDFVVVDLDGSQIGSDVRLPGELPIHTEIFRARPDVGAIAHFHCHHATSFSMSEHDLAPTYFLASIFYDGIPVHPDPNLVNDKARGEALVKTLGQKRAALMRAHGFVMTGADIYEMTAGVFIIEDNAKRTQIAASMGKYDIMGEEEMEQIGKEILDHKNPIMRIWTLCAEEAKAYGS